MAGLRGEQGSQLALPADHPRRPQHRHRHRCRHWRRPGGRPRRAQRAGQLLGLGRGRGIEALLQVPHQPRIGTLRLRDVAAQVMQPHQRPVEGLAVDVGLHQLLGQPRGGVQVAIGLSLRESGRAMAAPLLALSVQPSRKVGAVVELQIAEQLGGSVRAGRVFRLAGVVSRIDQDAVGDVERVLTLDEGGAARLAEPRDLLAQRLTRVDRVRPKQRCGARARDTGLERDQRQQSGGAPLQRPQLAVGSQQRRVAKQADLRGRAVRWHDAMIARR